MIAHDRPSRDFRSRLVDRFFDNPKELSPIGIVNEYICLIYSTGHYMVKRSRRIQAGVTRHGEIISDRRRTGK
jgi:hypothetical protein